MAGGLSAASGGLGGEEVGSLGREGGRRSNSHDALGLGIVEGLTKVFYPEASNIVVFVIMAIVLMIRPAGLFGKEK